MNANTPTVVLPCPPDQFRDFIVGLLGRAQTIEAIVGGPFEATKNDVENLFHLLEQRVTSQNDATLVQFTARVVYDDYSSVLLNSLTEFLTYNEVKPLISVGLYLSWTYLIKFQGRPFPEKQGVVISFETEPSHEQRLRMDYYVEAPIILRVEHTNRTWGADIEALLRGHLEMLKRPVGLARSFCNEFSGLIGTLAGGLAMLISFIAAYLVCGRFAGLQEAQFNALKKLAAEGNNNLLMQELDFLAKLIAGGAWTRLALFATVLLSVLLFISVGLGILVSTAAHDSVPSFLLLTAKSAEAKDQALKDMRHSWFFLGLSVLGSVLVGFASNALFYFALQYAVP